MERTAKETLALIEAGGYEGSRGAWVDLATATAAAVAGTRLYEPDALDAMVASLAARAGARPSITLENESSQTAAHRLTANGPVALLNFASAKSPGGGFLNGAKAQEEDLCRCSALYPCLLTQPRYYEVNRAERSALYTDHQIHSPAVPFFREHREHRLDAIVLASVITAPAPNAGALLRRDDSPESQRAIRDTMHRRIGHVLALAATQQHRRLILGAWGCGAFRNDPWLVARLFAERLGEDRFAGHFDQLHFPVLDRTKKKNNYRAFESALTSL